MSYDLRPYQRRAIEQLRGAISSGKRSVLLAMSTGAGKTRIIAEIMKSSWEKGYRSIFLAHRRELVKQTAERYEQYGVPATVLMSGFETDWSVPLVVASQQTFEARREFMDGNYQLIVFDEAHIGVKRQQRIIQVIRDVSPNAVVIGVTATPMTNSGPGLGSIYEELVQPVTMSELIEMGFLVPTEYYVMRPLDWNPEKELPVNSTGEYDVEAVGEWIKAHAILGDVVQNYSDHFIGRKFILFARAREHSIWFAEAFGKAGIPVAHIDFATPEKERNRILEAYRNGEIIGLTNVDIFSEGFDVPEVDLAIIATPIRSIPRYIQRIGRIMRPAPGKRVATVVDHGGVIQLHGPVTRYQVWALEPPKPFRVNPLHALKEVKRERERRCPVCGTTFKAGRKTCPECGYDFHYLPPGFEPPTEPAIMVAYDEAMRMDRLGKRGSCKPVRIPLGYTYEDIWAELLGYNERRPANGKRKWKFGFLFLLFYSITCECPNHIREMNLSVPAREPGPFVERMVRRYFMLSNKGYFEWKGKPPCFK